MTNDKRIGLLKWMMEQYDAKHENELDKPREKALKAMNVAVRKKYPEADMVVLRKYGVTRQDHCLRFVDSESNQVFGHEWGYGNAPAELADVPANGGCRSDDVFPISPSGRETIQAYAKAKDEADKVRSKKLREYESFVDVCKTVDDFHEVVALPEDLQRRYMGTAALVAVSEDLIVSLKEEFASR
jgi:hypothetical protein